MSFVFRSYGLWLRSSQPIVGVEPRVAAPRIDVDLLLADKPPEALRAALADQHVWAVSPGRDGAGVPYFAIWSLAGGAYYRIAYCDGAEFVLDRSGSWVWSKWDDSSTSAGVCSYLLGPVLGFVLRLRGTPCLHASAVAISGGIVAFTGPSGAGKTMLAGAFARMGYPVAADDILALECRGSRTWAKPGYPRLRLRSTAVPGLSILPSQLPDLPTIPPEQRHHLDLTRDGYRFEHDELPLTAVYLLQGRENSPSMPFAEPCAGREGLISLMGNVYAGSLLRGPAPSKEFELLSRVAATVPLRRLYPHEEPRRLAALCEVVLADLQRPAVCTPAAMPAAS